MSELYVCKQFEHPYERVCKIITTLEEHDKQIREDERKKVLDEVKNSIHDIYSQNLHCKADMCERETMGYDCEDCLATFLMGYIEDVMKAHK